MTRIPHVKGVTKAMRQVRDAAQRSLNALNRAASQRMAKGDYATAESLAAKGKEVKSFFAEIDSLRQRWYEISGTKRQDKKAGEPTPLWMYYQPILCIFWPIPASDSGPKWPLILIESGHRFWSKTAIFWSGSESSKSEAALDNLTVIGHHVSSSKERRRRCRERGYPCEKSEKY